jgi:hypothetical protein
MREQLICLVFDLKFRKISNPPYSNFSTHFRRRRVIIFLILKKNKLIFNLNLQFSKKVFVLYVIFLQSWNRLVFGFGALCYNSYWKCFPCTSLIQLLVLPNSYSRKREVKFVESLTMFTLPWKCSIEHKPTNCQRSGDIITCATRMLQFSSEMQQTWHTYYPRPQEQLLLMMFFYKFRPRTAQYRWISPIFSIF